MGKNKIWNVITYIIYAFVIIFAILAITSKISFFGIKLLVVKSGSMEPTIKTGSMVIDKQEKSYQVGNIVTYQDAVKPSETITHRIVAEETQNNTKLFTTQGDANQSPDSTKVTEGRVVGKVIFSIPYFGYVAAFARTVPGLIILIVVPGTIIIYEEIDNIRNELKKRRIKNSKSNKFSQKIKDFYKKSLSAQGRDKKEKK